jgi:hypothetical protein
MFTSLNFCKNRGRLFSQVLHFFWPCYLNDPANWKGILLVNFECIFVSILFKIELLWFYWLDCFFPFSLQVVGLGNLHGGYSQTRHSVGIIVLDHLAQLLKSSEWERHGPAFVTQSVLNIEEESDPDGILLTLVKPRLPMNVNGKCVQPIGIRFFVLIFTILNDRKCIKLQLTKWVFLLRISTFCKMI